MSTDAPVARYLATRGMRCPYCDSTNLRTEPLDPGEEEILQGVVCGACHKRWVDVYTLTRMEPEEEGQ